MIHPDLKLAIELRHQAYELESQASDLKTAANTLITSHLNEGEKAAHPDKSYGRIVVCKSSTSSKFNKDTLKIKLVEAGVAATVVVKAIKDSTTTSPRAGGIKYYRDDGD